MVSLSHIGLVRTVNEDRCVTQVNSKGLAIAVVADGMGGHNAGDIASDMAIKLLMNQLIDIDHKVPIDVTMEKLKQALIHTNEQIFLMSNTKPEYLGMGTTLVIAIAYDEHVIIGHIGDSRAYLIQQAEIIQLTNDHTLVSELVKSGQITEDDAEHHPRKNILTRALGTEMNSEIEFQCVPWKKGDIILLCTDGLSGLVPQDVILQEILYATDFRKASKKLVQFALDAGGFDNITLALIAQDKPTRKGQ